MTRAATMSTDREAPLVLHGVTHAEIGDVIGRRGSEFAGLKVWPIVEGSIAGLVSEAPRSPRWKLPPWLHRLNTPDSSAVLSALASIFPLVPLEPGTCFNAEAPLRKMLAGRGQELDEIVLSHSAFLQCDVRAEFDVAEAELDVTASSPAGTIRAASESELALVQRTLAQSVVGRQATFIARLRRCLTEVAADMTVPDPGQSSAGLARRILLARSSRRTFRMAIQELMRDAGRGMRLQLSPFMPPSSFRWIEVRGTDIAAVSAARAALGLDDSADRSAIRVAHRRALERFVPVSEGGEGDGIARLNHQFGLLDLVAEGQIRAARGRPDMDVRFDPKSLAETWLLKVHLRDAADRVA